MKFLRCAICGEKQRLKILYEANFHEKKIDENTFSARRTSNLFHYRFNKCLRCGLIFSSPILPLDRINKLYSKSKFNYPDETKYLKNTYAFYLEKHSPKSIKSARALDVGCGNGFFLEKLEEIGVNRAYGIEPSTDARNKAKASVKAHIKLGVLKEGLFPNSYFDLITCFHTLDHVVDPSNFIKNTFRLLKRGGAAYFIVHDTDGLSVKIFNEKSSIFDIEHIYLFNKSNLRKIFTANGFKRTILFSVKNTYPLEYWLRLAPIPKTIKKLTSAQFFSTVKKIPLTLGAGNIGIIAIKL